MKLQLACIIVSFILVAVSCPLLMPFLLKLRFGQVVRQLGPEAHYKKAGTPTMGGISIITCVVLACLAFSKKASSNLIFCVAIMLFYGLVGFFDDYIKVVQKNAAVGDKGLSTASLGMKSKHKIILQFTIALAVAVYVSYHPNIGTSILIPFTNIVWDLGILFIPFVVFTIIAVVNAVNLTDGLDGLASGVTMIVCFFFFIVAHYLVNYDMGIFMAAVIGACMGFICFNFNPAKLFMGDTGSLALGGAVVLASIFTRTELYILISGLIFVIEALSVILQVGYFKLTHGKRLFKMAPIHHHFELCGWEETRIVTVFWVFTAICVMVSLMAFNLPTDLL